MSAKASPFKHAAAVIAAYFLFYALFFAPVLFTGKLLAPGEALLRNLPLFYQPITLWSHDIFCGFPLAADPQAQSFYPPARLLSLIPGSWNFYVVLSFTLLSAMTYGFAYSMTRSKLAAAVAGLVYGLNAFSIANVKNIPVVNAMIWLPAVLWSLSKLSKELKAGWIAAGALAVAMMWLSGNFETSAYASLLLLAYALFLAFSSPVGMWRNLAVSSLVALFGIGMAAVQILPSLELAQLSYRWQTPAATLPQYCLAPDRILSLLFPFLYGGFRESLYGCDYFGSAPFDTICGYTGMLTLYLVCLAVMQGRDNREIRFWAMVLVVSLLLALGRSGPFAFLADVPPFFNHFRSHFRFLAVSVLSASVLAAFAIKLSYSFAVDWQTRRNALIAAALLFVPALTSAAISVGTLAVSARDCSAGWFSAESWANPAVIVPSAVLFVSVGAYLIWCCRPSDRKLQALLMAALTADLSSFSWFAEWHYRSPQSDRLGAPEHVARYAASLKRQNQRLFCLNGGRATLFELPPNLSLAWGVASVGGYSGLLPARHEKMLGIAANGAFAGDAHKLQAVLDMVAARYIVVPKSDRERLLPAEAEKGANFRLVEECGDAAVYENTSALPRCWIASGVLSMQPHMVLDTILNKEGQFDPRSLALMDGNFRLQLFRRRQGTHAEIRSIEESSIEIGAVCHGPSILVVSESYYPGWKAFVDEKKTDMYQMDYMLQGVPLNRGAHRIKLTYVPQTFYDGALMSALCLFATFFSAPLLSGWRARLRQGPVKGPIRID